MKTDSGNTNSQLKVEGTKKKIQLYHNPQKVEELAEPGTFGNGWEAAKAKRVLYHINYRSHNPYDLPNFTHCEAAIHTHRIWDSDTQTQHWGHGLKTGLSDYTHVKC